MLLAATTLTWQLFFAVLGGVCAYVITVRVAQDLAPPGEAPSRYTDRIGGALGVLCAGLAFLAVGAAAESRKDLRAYYEREDRAQERTFTNYTRKAVKLAEAAELKVYDRTGHFTDNVTDLRAVDPAFDRFAARNTTANEEMSDNGFANVSLRLGAAVNSVVITADGVNEYAASKTLLRPGKPAPQHGGRALRVAADAPAAKR